MFSMSDGEKFWLVVCLGAFYLLSPFTHNERKPKTHHKKSGLVSIDDAIDNSFVMTPTNKNILLKKNKYFELINKYSKLYDVPTNLITAIINAESSFNPKSYNSSTHATGLMQVLPSTASDFTNYTDCHLNGHSAKNWEEALFNPEFNINCGTFYFAKQLNDFSEKTQLPKTDKRVIQMALAAYNWGPTRVNRLIDTYGDDIYSHLPDQGTFNNVKGYISKIITSSKSSI